MPVGNLLAESVPSLIMSKPKHVHFWFENPDGSWFRRMPCVIKALSSVECWLFRIDYSRFGTPYRKRAHFATDLPVLMHAPLLCTRSHVHTVLRGAHPSGKLWTQVAEPYPFPVAELLAVAAACVAGWHHDHPRQINRCSCQQSLCLSEVEKNS